MALAWRRPRDGSWGPMLVTRRRSPWNRANWARGLLSTVQTNTAMWPWPTSRRADSFGGSGGSAGTAGSSGHPSTAHHIVAATLCPTPPSTHSPDPHFLMPSHVLVSPNPTPAWFFPPYPLNPPSAQHCPCPSPTEHTQDHRGRELGTSLRKDAAGIEGSIRSGHRQQRHGLQRTLGPQCPIPEPGEVGRTTAGFPAHIASQVGSGAF